MTGDIGEVAHTIGDAIDMAKQKDAEKNAPDVKAGAIAAGEQKQVDEEIKATADKDVEKTREQLSEN